MWGYLIPDFTHIVRNMESKGRNTFTLLSMTVAGPIFMKLVLVRLFVTNLRTEFHKNPSNALDSDITSQTG